MQRTLQPELLDSLPPGHPAAEQNRRDLRLTNAIVGNERWFARLLPRLRRAGESILEIGAGVGDLGLRLRRHGVPVDGLDLWPRPAAWPAERAWHVADLRAFPGYDRYAVIVGNLIFHQFKEAELADLGAKLRGARVILASEPARRRVSQALFRTLGPLLGANYVSLHDAHVSIAAGFRDDELPRLLGLPPAEWDVSCHTTLLGVYRMIAVRRA